MVIVNRITLALAMLLIVSAALHIQTPGYSSCAGIDKCRELKVYADKGLYVLGFFLLVAMSVAYKRQWSGRSMIAVAIAAALMLGAVAIHLMEFSVERYISSPLIAVEMISLVACLLTMLMILLWPWLIYKKRWKDFGMNLLAFAFVFGAIVAALYIDEPTLIYMS
jgi:uncharacterized YccA/Bax inhibitor family protein